MKNCSFLPLFVALFLLGRIANAEQLTLTLTTAVLENVRTAKTTTLQVQVDGLNAKDCSTANVDSLVVIHQSQGWTAVYDGKQGGMSGQLWSGNRDGSILGGNAKVMAALVPPQSSGRVALGQTLSWQRSNDMSCKLTGHIINSEFQQSINIGTFADGTVWAEVAGWTDEANERVVEGIKEVEYGSSHRDDPYIMDGTAGNDDGTIVQMDIAYTWEALCLEAGLSFPCDFSQTGGIISRTIFLIEEMNQILEDSDSNLRVQGIRAWRTEDVAEPFQFSAALNAMATPNDGIFETPDLLALRQADCADLVGLLTAEGDRITTGGQGVILGQAFNIGPASYVWAFVSSLETISLTGFTFTHEVGHLMGCRHDLQSDPSYPLIAHGYLSHTENYATVMSTYASCSPFNPDLPCQRLPLFSNPPPFLYEGLIMGDPLIADNVRRLEESRLFVSNLLDSTICGILAPGPPTPPEPAPTMAPTLDCVHGEELFRLELLTDAFGMETAWDIYNLCTGDMVAVGDRYGDNTLYIEHVCLRTDQEYLFTIYDSFGDGICCDADFGKYTISFEDFSFESDGEFEFEESTAFGSCRDTPVTQPTQPPPTTHLPVTPAPSPAQEVCSSCDADLCSGKRCLYNSCTWDAPGASWMCPSVRTDFGNGVCGFTSTASTCESCEVMGQQLYCCEDCTMGM